MAVALSHKSEPPEIPGRFSFGLYRELWTVKRDALAAAKTAACAKTDRRDCGRTGDRGLNAPARLRIENLRFRHIDFELV
jgi:hypothetical protein